MAKTGLNSIFAVLRKDVKSELRTRYAISSFFLFVVTTITMLVFATAGTDIDTGIAAGFLWVVMFFGAMTGLGRSFISEEERGTMLQLKLSSSATSVYFGKLLFNILLSILLNSLAVILFYLMFSKIKLGAPGYFIISYILGSLGIASASTIISAIIAKANTKGALFPILSFPILLPLLLFGIESTRMTMDGAAFSALADNFRLMIAYSGIVIVFSYILYDFLWKE